MARVTDTLVCYIFISSVCKKTEMKHYVIATIKNFTGHGKPEKIRIYGSLENLEFFAYYIKDDKVIAISSVGADPIAADFANFLQEGNILTEAEIEKQPFGWIRNKPKDLQIRFETESVVDP